MAERIERFDWSATPLGPIETWPTSLKTAVGLLIHSKFPKAITWGPELVTIHNDAFKPLLGEKPEALGRSFRDVWHEAWETIGPIAERAYRGEATFIEDFPLVIDRHGYPEQCYFTFCYSPIYDESGKVGGMMDTVMETTGKVQAERVANEQNIELAHRIRNTLAAVSALTVQTLKSKQSTEEASAAILARLRALAETHSLLTNSGVPAAEVSQIVDRALEPYATDRTRYLVLGPKVRLPERPALALALALNELITNAVKHGSLSVDDGRVDVHWSIDGENDERRVFRFSWSEVGGPPCKKPNRTSFGTRLLETVVPADFRGKAKLTYATSGLKYDLDAELVSVQVESS